MSLGRMPTHRKRFSWRLNDNLLSDSVCFQDIIHTIRDFIKDHARDDTNPLTKWETLKCVLRGKLIQHGSRLKQARTADISHLLAKIASHKHSPDPTTQLDLYKTQRDLLRILAERSLVARDRGRFTHYSEANKYGRHLAHVLNPRHTRKSIPFIHSPIKGKLYTNSAIAEEFREYYSTL